ncbi:MAG: hypothetical protein WA208_13725, partial [Thermoanaerobaculia bacterium]
DAKSAREKPSKKGSPEDLELTRKREGLELSRRRIVKELEAARSPLRRAALEHALAFLDGELRALGVEPGA